MELKDLVSKKGNEIIHGKLVAKVLHIGNEVNTTNGKTFKKIKIGDEDYKTYLKLWNDSINRFDLEVGDIFSITCFSMDNYDKKGNNRVPNLLFYT